MIGAHGRYFRHDVDRKRRYFRAFHVDMQGKHLGCRCQPAIEMDKFLIEMDAFFVMVNQVKTAFHLVTQMQFAYVADMDFGGIYRQ